MKRNIFIASSIVLALMLLLCSCAEKQSQSSDEATSSASLNSQKTQIEKFLRLMYSTSDENSGANSISSATEIKTLTTKASYQSLTSSGAIFTAVSCETDFSCELSIKNIIVTPESDVKNAFNFVTEISVKFENGSTSDYIQYGQITVFEENGNWLIDNFYEDQPNLYNQISKEFAPTS